MHLAAEAFMTSNITVYEWYIAIYCDKKYVIKYYIAQ